MVRLNDGQRDRRLARGNGARYVFENLQRAVGPEVCLEGFRVASDAEFVAIRPKLTLNRARWPAG